jgi:hypothetical protein
LKVGLFIVSVAFADTLIVGPVTDVQVISNGNSADKVVVYGNFTPSTGCPTNNAVELINTDNYYKESYALLLAAKLSGTPVRISFSFCDSNTGLGRANGYTISHY